MARKTHESANGQANHGSGGSAGEAHGAAPIIDLETRVTEEDHTSLKLWLRMLSCTTRIE